MKKLILSATFVLVCFTAQAQTTETPKKSVESTTMRYPWGTGCRQVGYAVAYCISGPFQFTVIIDAPTCAEACAKVDEKIAQIIANPSAYCTALNM